MTFTPAQRLWHVRRGWCTFLLHDDWDTDTSEVLFDDGEAARITTTNLSTTHPDGDTPPPVPPAALAEFADCGLIPPTDQEGTTR